MKRCGILVLAALASTTGCINWAGADASWCNSARLSTLHGVCGIGDTTIAGRVGAIAAAVTLGGAADDGLSAAAGTSAGSFVAGTVRAPATIGATVIDSRGGRDGYLARIADDGQPAEVRSFGGAGDDTVADLIAGDGEDLFLAANFSGSVQGPDGQTLATSAGSDAFIVRLDGALNVGAVATLGGAAGSDARIAELAWADGQLAVLVQFRGTYTYEGHLLEAPGGEYQVAALVLDRDLHYLWHVASSGCSKLLADSVGLGSDGALYLAIRLVDSGATCELVGRSLAPGTSAVYLDAVVRVDPNAGAPIVRWSIIRPSPRNLEDRLHNRPETPTSLAVRGDEVHWAHGQPVGGRSQTAYLWNLDRLDPDDGSTSGATLELGKGDPTQQMLGKIRLDPDGSLWMFGAFTGNQMSLTPFTNGKFASARSGFVVRYAPNPADSWARVIVGRSTTQGTNVADVVSIPGRPTMIAGTYDIVTVASYTFLDSRGGDDGFVLMLEP